MLHPDRGDVRIYDASAIRKAAPTRGAGSGNSWTPRRPTPNSDEPAKRGGRGLRPRRPGGRRRRRRRHRRVRPWARRRRAHDGSRSAIASGWGSLPRFSHDHKVIVLDEKAHECARPRGVILLRESLLRRVEPSRRARLDHHLDEGRAHRRPHHCHQRRVIGALDPHHLERVLRCRACRRPCEEFGMNGAFHGFGVAVAVEARKAAARG